MMRRRNTGAGAALILPEKRLQIELQIDAVTGCGELDGADTVRNAGKGFSEKVPGEEEIERNLVIGCGLERADKTSLQKIVRITEGISESKNDGILWCLTDSGTDAGKGAAVLFFGNILQKRALPDQRHVGLQLRH